MSEPLAPGRVRGRARAAAILAESVRARVAAGDHGATLRAVARHLEVSHTQVERWADPLAGRALALGDLLAARPSCSAETEAELRRIFRHPPTLSAHRACAYQSCPYAAAEGDTLCLGHRADEVLP